MEAIADSSYKISRPLFFYVKNAHRGVIPGLDDFVKEYVSDEALAPGGYLTDRGLVPLGDEPRQKMRDAVANAKHMSRYSGRSEESRVGQECASMCRSRWYT